MLRCGEHEHGLALQVCRTFAHSRQSAKAGVPVNRSFRTLRVFIASPEVAPAWRDSKSRFLVVLQPVSGSGLGCVNSSAVRIWPVWSEILFTHPTPAARSSCPSDGAIANLNGNMPMPVANRSPRPARRMDPRTTSSLSALAHPPRLLRKRSSTPPGVTTGAPFR
jgi:hypothetical protein